MTITFNTLMSKNIARGAALAALTLAASNSFAMDLQGWSVFGGGTSIQPKVSSGDLSAPSLPGTKVDVDSATSLTGGIGYDPTENVSFSFVMLALPFKHDIKGDGAIKGVGKLGTIKQLPPTLFAQYKFLDAQSAFRPYLGLGLTYAYFFAPEGSGTLTALTNPGGTPTTLKVDSKFGFTPQIGGTVALNKNWFIDANVFKTFVKTKTTLSTGQSIETKLDPIGINLWIGYKF